MNIIVFSVYDTESGKSMSWNYDRKGRIFAGMGFVFEIGPGSLLDHRNGAGRCGYSTFNEHPDCRKRRRCG